MKKTLLYSNKRDRGYPDNLVDKTLPDLNFSERMSTLSTKQTKNVQKHLRFVTEYRPSVPNLKTIQVSKWLLIENEPLVREIYTDPAFLQKREIFERRTRIKEQSFDLDRGTLFYKEGTNL